MFQRPKHPGWMAIVPRKHSVELAHVVRGDAKPSLRLLESTTFEGGEASGLARARRAHGLQRYRCSTWVDPSAYQVVQVAAPKVAEAELRAALRWSIKDLLDFPAEQAMIDALPIPSDGMPPGRDALALVVAAKREALASRVQAFQSAQIALAVIDVQETAQRNIAALFETPARGLALLSLHEAGGLLTFTRGGELYGLRAIDAPLGALADPAQRESVFERIGLELQRSLDGFDRQFSQVPLQRLLIAGHPAAESLADYLKDNLYLPVEIADLNSVLDTGGHPALQDPTQQSAWYTVIGMALRDEAVA